MIKSVFPAVLSLLILFSFPVFGQVDPLLQEAVASLKPEAEIEATLARGDRWRGVFAGCSADQLLLLGSFAPGDPGSTVSLELQEIVRLNVAGSGSGRGFRAGFTTGVVTGGSLSLLWGLAISSLSGDDDHTLGIVGFTLVGGMAGGVALGALGGGIGALTRVWETVYESPDFPGPPDTPAHRNTQVGLGLGLAAGFQEQDDYQQTGLYGHGGLQVPLGAWADVGPELGYYDLGGSVTKIGPGYTYESSVSPVISIGLAARFQPRKSGWAPYLVAGTGYYIADGEYLGLSLGGGLRYRTLGRQEMRLEIRDHFSIYDDSHSFVLDHFITLGANFSFGL